MYDLTKVLLWIILFNVVSLNVSGLHNSIKRNSIYRWVKDNKYHTCCIQESFCTQANVAQFKRGWDGDIYISKFIKLNA